MTVDVLCSGPGPHQPVSGVLGQAQQSVGGLLCPLCAVAAQASAEAQQQQALDGLAAAASGLTALQGQLPGATTQLQADVVAVTSGWATLTADQQTQIMLRVLNGFGSLINATLDHAKMTGVIPPA